MAEKKERTRTFCLVGEGEDVGVVAGFEGADVIVLCALEDLCKGRKVDTEGYGTVATEALEADSLEIYSDEGDVGVIHGLEFLGRANALVAS